ncbi:MAG: FG-GAP repeat domain-containing protein, partial [Marinicellaceae bacterium]
MNRQKYLQLKMVFITSFFFNTSFAGGGTWSEIDDAPSFPEKISQKTQGEGQLLQLFGQSSNNDFRDSYCIKIVDPENFRVTTDSNIDPTASATFDTRLYLFDIKGKPLLFNDDTVHNTSPFHSTLTGVANDGSGFVLNQPGEYNLVVSGFAQSPLDSSNNSLFNFNTDDSSLINGENPSAGRFAGWDSSTPATGEYILGMQGVEFCQEKLDIIATNTSDSQSSLCFGDGQGEFLTCNNESSSSDKADLAIGYFNKDKYLDVVFDQFNALPTLCLGGEVDGFQSCQNLNIGETNTTDIALADINYDGNLDAAFIFAVGQVSKVLKICLGDGTNGFLNGCTDFPVADRFYSNIDFAYMDTDKNIDLIVHGFNSITICPGDGLGDFGSCNEVSVQSGRGLEVYDVNNDNHLDIVTYAETQPAQVCINDGTGVLTCSAMNGFSHDTTGMDMADLNADGNIDAVFSNTGGFSSGTNKVCLGDGLGAFNCSDISGVIDDHLSVKLGDLNQDNILDAVFGMEDKARICNGVGDGTFVNCRNDERLKLTNVELGEFADFTKWTEINDAASFPDGQAQVT